METSLFAQSLIVAPRARAQRPLAIALSLVAQAAVIGVLVLLPLWQPAALPARTAPAAIAAPLAAAPPPAAPPTVRRLSAAIPNSPLLPPAAIPPRIALRAAAAPPSPAGLGVPASGLPNGFPGGMPGGLGVGRPPAPPTPPAVRAGPLRVGGAVQAARCLACPPPAYPALAREARVSGVVRLAAIIGRDGRVMDLHVLSGAPLLVSTTLRAVSRWRYRPTELNGQPVEVRTEIRVVFNLR